MWLEECYKIQNKEINVDSKPPIGKIHFEIFTLKQYIWKMANLPKEKQFLIESY